MFCLDRYDGYAHINNCGAGSEASIRDLAEIVARVVDYQGKIALDPTKPDGTPYKLMDSGRIAALGWAPEVPLEDGVRAPPIDRTSKTTSPPRLDRATPTSAAASRRGHAWRRAGSPSARRNRKVIKWL